MNLFESFFIIHTKEVTSWIKLLEQELSDVQKHLNGIKQYPRVNNIEIVGLPEADEDKCNKDVMLKALNSLEHLSYEVVKEDIDIQFLVNGKMVSEFLYVNSLAGKLNKISWMQKRSLENSSTQGMMCIYI